MTMKQFLKEYRSLIDDTIKHYCGENFKINNNERRIWVENDEVLYNLAKSKGVKVCG